MRDAAVLALLAVLAVSGALAFTVFYGPSPVIPDEPDRQSSPAPTADSPTGNESGVDRESSTGPQLQAEPRARSTWRAPCSGTPPSPAPRGDVATNQTTPYLSEDVGGSAVPTERLDRPLFANVSREARFDYRAPLSFLEGETVAGVFVSDVDGDGRPDLLALGSGPVLFRNRGGVFCVSDRLPELEHEYTSALFVDHDVDGDDDLYLLSDDHPVFLENEDGRFVERDVGLPSNYSAVRGASAADYDGDGCPDLFVAQAGDWTERRPAGRDDRNVTIAEDNGRPNRLFSGDCGTFNETTERAGIEGTAWSLATSFVDFTNDGRPDVHVANDFNNDVLYRNLGDGRFERRILPNVTNRNGMSSEPGDVDGDGLLDIVVTNIYATDPSAPDVRRYGGRVEGNNLLLNRGNGTFVDAAEEFGVERGGWGWAALLEDFDNDGDRDLFHTVTSSGEEAAAFWLRRGDRFARIDSASAGIEPAAGFGVAALDVDGDAALDLAVSDRGGQYTLYENRAGGNALRVRLRSAGRTVLGTRVTVTADGTSTTRVRSSRSDYQSQSSRVLHFGLGNASRVDALRVAWPDGDATVRRNVTANRTVTLTNPE